jgi:hypothetical protein
MTHNAVRLALCLSLAGFGPCDEAAPLPRELFGVDKPSPLPPPQPVEHSAPATPAAQANQSPLRRHSDAANAMRKAAIAGQLADFQRAAASLDSGSWSLPLRDDPGNHIEQVRVAARSAAAASALPAATAALGALASACSRCHEDVGGPRGAEIISAPADLARNGDETMIAHAAAEVALWQGLVFPSDDGWHIGAGMLASAPGLDSDVREVSALARRTVDLAREAATAPREARAGSYARVLATCAACHSRLGIDPG